MHKFTARCYKSDPDDVMQELRVRLWRAQRNFRPDRGAQFGTYLYRVFLSEVARQFNHFRPHDSLERRQLMGFDVGYNDDEGYGLAEMASVVGSTAQELSVLAETAGRKEKRHA